MLNVYSAGVKVNEVEDSSGLSMGFTNSGRNGQVI